MAISPPPASVDSPHALSKQTSPSASLLVVDDNEMNRDVLTRRLRRAGYHVSDADGYISAMQKMEEEPFDLLLLDIMMPEINGIEMLKRLRQRYSLMELPIIMVTAKDESAGIVEALQLGANDYITKPVDFPVAMARIQAQLMRKSAEYALKESEERYRNLFEQASDLIHVTDEKGKILYANQACCERLGVSHEELVGRDIKSFLQASDQAAYEAMIQRLLTHRQGERVDTRFLCRDGQLLEVEGNLRCYQAQGAFSLHGIFRDMTERKRLEGLKNEFVSMVSHELRTPLTSILGSLGLLMGGVAGEMSAQAKVMLDITQKNGGRLLRLINDLLDMEKIESGKMEFRLREVPLCEILAQALDANRAFAQGYNVKLQRAWVDDPALLVYVDPERVLQVLANLLSNAIKFSPHGGSVEIDLAVEGEVARVAIRDQGEGISLAFQGRIFEKFAQADASNTRKKGGTGLGLSIAKAIVERLQGDIGFETQLGRGTTFFFSLPLIKKRNHVSAKAAHVLICEDDAEVAFLLHRLLEQSGFSAKIVSSPEEALVALQQESFQAMTLDIHLAEDSGMRLLRQMREDPALKELPVVIVSALSIQEGNPTESQALGVFDWLQKPFKPQRLIESLRRICGLAGKEAGAS